MAEQYRIGMLWMEGALSFMEQLCIQSFLDQGHEVVLYHYGPLRNVPQGVRLADAQLILPSEAQIIHSKSGSPAPHADRFRYHLLAQSEGLIWADTDAYCVKPFRSDNGHYYGWESPHHVNIGVLGLPAQSPTLQALIEYTSDEFAIPPFAPEAYQAELRDAIARGVPVSVSDQPWGIWGPRAFTHFLKETGEIRHALPTHVLYPIPYAKRGIMLRRAMDLSDYITDETHSIHFYGRRIRHMIAKQGGIPRTRSLIGKLLRRHGIDPALAPVPTRSAPSETEGRE